MKLSPTQHHVLRRELFLRCLVFGSQLLQLMFKHLAILVFGLLQANETIAQIGDLID
jgi:hypothetical protein